MNVIPYKLWSLCINIIHIYIGMMMIRLGESDIIMAGGVDSTSDAPIKIRPEVRGAMIDIRYVSLL